MRTNVKSKKGSSTGASGQPPMPVSETDPSTLGAPELPRGTTKAHAGSWSEDWSDPAQRPQMSPIWPLLWLSIPFALLVLYGYFSGR